jgi:hypothetical protein
LRRKRVKAIVRRNRVEAVVMRNRVEAIVRRNRVAAIVRREDVEDVGRRYEGWWMRPWGVTGGDCGFWLMGSQWTRRRGVGGRDHGGLRRDHGC